MDEDTIVLKEFIGNSKPVERIKIIDYINALREDNNNLRMRLRDLLEENERLREEAGYESF